MRYLFLLLLLSSCSRSDGLENGYYVTSINDKANFFCSVVYASEKGTHGRDCVDMECNFAGDRRIRSTIILREAVIMPTKGFNYKLVNCGPKE